MINAVTQPDNIAQCLGNRWCPEVVEAWGDSISAEVSAVILLGFTNKICLSKVFVTL